MKKPTILVVEDESIVGMDLRATLAKFNYSVLPVACTAGQAVAEAERNRPDLVLMDIRLQGSIDGIAAAQEIHGRFNIPIIYLSAQSREEILERVRTDGSSAFLKKPYDPDELRGAIQSVLEPK